MKQARFIRSVDAFGWRVVQMALDAGNSYGVLIPREIPRESIGTITLWTKGVIHSLNKTTNIPGSTRVPGTLSTQLGPIASGRYVLTADIDSEWWCIDRKTNNNLLPVVKLFRLEANTSTIFTSSTKLMLVKGTLKIGNKIYSSIPSTVEIVSEANTAEAITDCLGFIFESTNNV